MADIFLSYSREDQTAARRFAEAFERAGFSVWWDTTLSAGENYDEVTEAALRGAKAVVVLWSPRSAQSRWVRAEATLAARAKTLVPVTIEACERPIMFELTQTAELSHWTGAPNDSAWRAFLTDLSRFVSQESSSATPSQPISSTAAVPPKPRATLLAVMAFDNLSNDPELSYFSDGISEEILYTVSRTKGLRVIGKASSFQFRGLEKTAQKIGVTLGASHMLDGSIRRAGDNIRINVELVDTASFETLWSERYDRALTDIFALQDEIAVAVAAALHHHFAPARTATPVDPVAYDLYLQARAIFAQDLTWSDQAKCASLLERAVSIAPDFASAWGKLATYRKGEAAVVAAMRGLELDPDCASSLAALARTKPSFSLHADKLDLASRAYKLAPNDELVASIYLTMLMTLGLLTRACEVASTRYKNDPLSPLAAGVQAILCRYAERNAEAVILADEAITEFPGSEYAKWVRGAIAIFDGDLETAAAVAATVSANAEVQSLLPPIMFMRAMAAMDPATRAEHVGAFLRRAAPKSFLLEIALASAVGEAGLAMDHLLETIDAGRPLSFTANNDGRDPTGATVTTGLFMPLAKPLRTDVRFAEVCVRLGLFDCWKSTGAWPDCVAELAPIYDLKAECEKIAVGVGRYVAQYDA